MGETLDVVKHFGFGEIYVDAADLVKAQVDELRK